MTEQEQLADISKRLAVVEAALLVQLKQAVRSACELFNDPANAKYILENENQPKGPK